MILKNINQDQTIDGNQCKSRASTNCVTSNVPSLRLENRYDNKKRESSDNKNFVGLANSDVSTKSNDNPKQSRFNGFEIAWLNLSYSIEPNIFEDPRWGRINSLFHKERRTILKSLCGGVKSGQMVALMGPSGAGKTCLLDCIAGLRLTGIEGKMFVRGRRTVQLNIVPQYDDFMPQFTVEEIITYGSKIKNPPETNHRLVVQGVIDQLGLQACRSNNIQKCSGGQRKRVAIAQELVSRPNILILDEPTSGLDSSCCHQTIRVLRSILDNSTQTSQPMAIITTIHQPSAKVFQMFDLVYLLSKTGHTAYSGPPDDLLSTVSEITGLECPQYSNPSDYMIELVSYDYGEEPVEKLIEFELEKAKQYVRDYSRLTNQTQEMETSTLNLNSERLSDSCSTISTSLASISSLQTSPSHVITSPSYEPNCLVLRNETGRPATSKPFKPSKSDTHLFSVGKDQSSRLTRILMHSASSTRSEYKNNVTVPLRKATSSRHVNHPFFKHLYLHLHRSFLQQTRDSMLNNTRILIHIGFASLLVLLYGKRSGQARGCPPILGLPPEITDPNKESLIDLSDNVGFLFMCIMMITYVSIMSMVLTFPIDIKTVGKEYKNGWYSTTTYFLGKTIAELPFIIIYPVGYSLITWFSTDQGEEHLWRYFGFTGFIIMNAMNSQSFGLILGATFVNSIAAATFLGPIITIPWYLFTGFTKRIHRLSEPFKTMSNFLFTRHIFEGLLDTVYGHERCNCSAFLNTYQQLRYEEASRLGQIISNEALSSLDYYDSLDKVSETSDTDVAGASDDSILKRTVDVASNVFASEGLDLTSLMETNSQAASLFSFGIDFEPSCPSDYRNFVTQDFHLDDKTAQNAFWITFIMLIAIRFVAFVIVTWKIKNRQL